VTVHASELVRLCLLGRWAVRSWSYQRQDKWRYDKERAVSRILNTQEVALPDEFIGHERVCDHCGTKFLCDSGDVAYKHEATHSRSNEQEQFRSVSVPCPTCSSVLVLRTSIGAGYQPAPGGFSRRSTDDDDAPGIRGNAASSIR
jgi:hypothetical protein